MKVLIFTWKDRQHPHAGGAEVVNEELVRRLVADGHDVTMLVGGFPGSAAEEAVDGYRVIRVGSWYTVYVRAYQYYKKNLQGWADLVIEEVNTVPFFTKFYVKEPSLLFFHQLCRRIWFYQMSAPVNLMGFLAEPLYLRLISRRRGKVITVSESTRRDLQRYGFDQEEIALISEGIKIKPIDNLDKVRKYTKPTLLSFGCVRSMKRTLHQVKAFEIAKERIPHLQLRIAGQLAGRYGKKVWRYIMKSRFSDDIEYMGAIPDDERDELMQKSHVILQTAVKEGWGLTITEAASQGTPAAVYDVDGLRDSVRDGETGVVTACNPSALAEGIVAVLQDETVYATMREAAWRWSQDITFDRSYSDFKEAVELA
ncbi:MAG TPA: glycosyltransferase family 4 protein [Candidatus Saccharimonadales bacterium]|nr:glycosyltransferase family 4 protein [Candidatus Saccharimonadales bacterium]